MHFVFQFYLSDTDDLHTTSYDLKLSESMYFLLIAQPHVVYSFSRREAWLQYFVYQLVFEAFG